MINIKQNPIILSLILVSLFIGIPLFGYMHSEASSADITVLLIENAPHDIVFIADPHLREENLGNMNQIIEDINTLNTSVLLIGGDFIFGEGDNFYLQHIWSAVNAPTYAVLGNHDYHSGIETSTLIGKIRDHSKVNLSKDGYNVSKLFDETTDVPFAENLTKSLNENNVQVLKNDYVITNIQGKKLLIVGVDDGFAGLAQPPVIPENDAFTLYLIHEPDFRSEWEADLVLSGHTHGGQFFPKNFNLSGMVLSGIVADNNQFTYISRGVGTSNLNQEMRLFATPEIVVINPTIPPEVLFPDKKVDYITIPQPGFG